MRLRCLWLLICLSPPLTVIAQVRSPKSPPFAGYVNNRLPLRPNPYVELPLGAVAARGWLHEMLLRQKKGATGQLDDLYPLVMGKRNGWLGGDGDQWERGPYWIDGLVPLAYLLHDKELIAKTKPWIEWAINSQQPNGYFGPLKDYPNEPGIQRDNCQDWWPKMVMLKILKQYYMATSDQRVITLMTNYFRYQLQELPTHPLDHWTFWARFRAGDNLMVVYWLYNQTGDKFLLDLAELIHKQTFDFTNGFLNTNMLAERGSIHCVNLAQGIKEPLIYYQQHPDARYVDATNKGLSDLRRYNGMAHGLYGGDEALHGNNPTQGSEFCSAVEMMFSLESMLTITGDVAYADQLEKIAFNALPAQATDDFMGRQYFQQANQVMLTRQMRNFGDNHGGTDLCMGLLTGYPCCTANMHQGWPKFTHNLWYATSTADGETAGLAALVYAPSEVKARVADGTEVTLVEETNYPFNDTISFTVRTEKKGKAVNFPLHLRVPAWCKKGTIRVNGQLFSEAQGNQIVPVSRSWQSGDVVTLTLPMPVFTNTWYERSISIERGPLTYALKMGEEAKTVVNDKDPISYGTQYTEVRPTTPWNYALVETPAAQLDQAVVNLTNGNPIIFPWNLKNAPSEIRVKARRLPSWKLYNDMTGPIPYSFIYGVESAPDEETITLVPYGCTVLRISQFPVVRKRN
ncbi:beta-L-arabinofuranosidase domain-containing protein [Fibrella arboris]|uniref:beta-L-arabinofuranosidase domain-containing protein n=1 Tax=Fibrella arboris TaxID=3242486 RepID=UPI003521BADF